MKTLKILLLAAALLSAGCVQEDSREEENATYMNLTVSSPAFEHMQRIPVEYTCDGLNKSPPLDISDIPDGTKTMVLIVEDPDAPIGTWDHWVVWNIPPTASIKADFVPGVAGLTSSGKYVYGGPCPPSGAHRYFFTIYALDTGLPLAKSSGKKEVLEAMKGHILAKGEIVGVYSR